MLIMEQTLLDLLSLWTIILVPLDINIGHILTFPTYHFFYILAFLSLKLSLVSNKKLVDIPFHVSLYTK